jgi:hypothetical protein
MQPHICLANKKLAVLQTKSPPGGGLQRAFGKLILKLSDV